MSSNTVNQWAMRLAYHLIRVYHGEISEKLCMKLASRGRQSLPDLIRASEMPASQVKQALLLLIQHNYVVVYCIKEEEEGQRGPPKPPQYLYEARVAEMLLILRKPKFLLHILQEHGAQSEQLLRLLLDNGRLSFDQMVKALAAQESWTEEHCTQVVKGALLTLVNYRYIERAPPCTLPPPHVPVHPGAVKVKRGAKAGAPAEQQAALRGLDEMRYDHLRFKVPSSILQSGVDNLDNGPAEPGAAEPTIGLDGTKLEGQEGDGEAEGREGEEGEGEGEGEAEETSPAGAKGAAGKKKAGGSAAGGSAASKTTPGTKRGAPGAAAAKSPAVKKARIKAGTKREEVATEVGAAAALKARAAQEAKAVALGQDGIHEVLWRVNSEEFNRRFRHIAIVDMARDRFDSDTARVLEAMLAAGRGYETQVNEERGSQLNCDEVTTHLRRIWGERHGRRSEEAGAGGGAEAGGRGGAEGAVGVKAEPESGALEKEEEQEEDGQQQLEELCEKVPAVITTLCNDALEFVSYVGEGPAGAMYCVNMVRFIDTLKLKHLEAVAKEKFGEMGVRIFRMLLLRGQLEQKQVSDCAMIPARDTRETLYRMLTSGFVFMQDIPKTADRAPTRTFYTWRSDWAVTCDRFAVELYRAAGNVWARLQHEMQRARQLLDLIEEATDLGKLTFSITPAQRSQLQRLNTVSQVLDAGLMQLDDSIALFNTF